MLVRPVVASVIVALVLGCAGCSAHRDRSMSFDEIGTGPNTVSFKVEGMACLNCAREIAHELEEVPGVKAAAIDFDSATARVRLDEKAPASTEALHAAVERWRKEHFGAEEDPNCLDPARRAEIKKGM